MNLWKTEPALILAVIQAGLALGVAFGLKWTAEQVGMITAFTAAVLGLVTRSRVSPTP